MKIAIPDEAVFEWLQVYRECGCSEERIDEIMRTLNDTWAIQKLGPVVDEEMFRFEDAFRAAGREKEFDEARRQFARGIILERLRKMPPEDVERGIRPDYRN